MSEAPKSHPIEGSWESLYHFRQHLDDLMESFQGQGRDLHEILEALLLEIQEKLQAQGAVIRLDADPRNNLSTESVIGDNSSFSPAHEPGWTDQGGLHVYTTTLDVGDEILGTLSLALGLAFSEKGKLSKEWIEHFAEAMAEQVDNLVYHVRESERQHRLAVHVQLCLETPVFEDGLDEAIHLLVKNLPIQQILFLYRNDHFLAPEKIAYRLYDEKGENSANNFTCPHPELDPVLKTLRLDSLEGSDLPDSLNQGMGPEGEMPLVHAGRQQHIMGRLIYWLEEGAPITTVRAQAQILRSCVVQRLADYSKETRNLEKYFPPGAVLRLLREEDYDHRFLVPRLETIGILFADVSGFTALSETVLQDPRDTGKFIDLWSEGATRILMEHGGVMDKLIGDCVMGLFGPPFFEQSPAEMASSVCRAALEIRQFTREMMEAPEMAKLKQALEKAGGLDVSTGVQIAPAAVGIFGPNRDYTAFGSGINNTARIQAVAKPGQTLALQGIVDALKGQEELSQGLAFGESGEVKVKNVARPLVYYTLGSD
jgi:class 3 adenylate cyclase